jgi:hypothetical protein
MSLVQEKLITTRELVTRRGADVTSAGALNDVSTAGTSFMRFTLATSITGLANGENGKEFTLTNSNTVDVSIANESASSAAANRIITGTGGNVSLKAGASLLLKYDDGASRWRVVGGVAGGFTAESVQQIANGATFALGTDAFQTIFVSGSGGNITASLTPFGATPPLNGTTIFVVGLADAQTVTFEINNAANGCLLAGPAELGRGSSLLLQYSSTLARYLEITRNMIGGYA